MLLNPPKPAKLKEKLRVHKDFENSGIEWWGKSSDPHLSFGNSDLEFDCYDKWYCEVEKLDPGLYIAVINWYWDYEPGEYGTILSQWPEVGNMRFVKMKKQAWGWYWYEQIKEKLKDWKWWCEQLCRKVWGVTESDGTIGHWLCSRRWLYQALLVWFCAKLGIGSKTMIEDRWFERHPRIEFRIERDWYY